MKTNKKKYTPPKSCIMQLEVEPFMNTSGDSRFHNKLGINQEKTHSISTGNTFWNTGIDGKE